MQTACRTSTLKCIGVPKLRSMALTSVQGGELDWPMSNLSNDLHAALEASSEASVVLTQTFGRLKQVESKGQEGLVSEADRNAELKVRETLQRLCPGDGILGEEMGWGQGPTSLDGRVWVVDPLDGTTNYVHGFPFFAVSIGLAVDGAIQVGVVEAPLLGWRFHATRGGGAFWNGQPIRCSDKTQLEESLVATGFSYSRSPEMVEEQVSVFKEMVRRCRGVRRAGAAALDLCMVGWGAFDAYWEKTLKPWDCAAGSLIAAEAGAAVTDFDGKPFTLQRDDVVACAPGLLAEVIGSIRYRG